MACTVAHRGPLRASRMFANEHGTGPACRLMAGVRLVLQQAVGFLLHDRVALADALLQLGRSSTVMWPRR